MRVPTTSWIRMPISSWKAIRPRSLRYSMGSGPNTEAYTSAIASIRASRRSARSPWLARNRLLYFPEKAVPTRSSSRPELRTMMGVSPKSSRQAASQLTMSPGKPELLKICTMLGYSSRICSAPLNFCSRISSRSL